MEIVDRYGLTLALVGPEELGDEPWLGADRPVDVVRVPAPPAEAWDELAARGFVRKPSVITWVSALGPDEESHLAGLGVNARKSIRYARGQARAAGLREVVEDPVTPESLERFYALYRERVAEMPTGVPFGLDYRDAILHGPRPFFGVFCYDGDEMAGGVLVLECPGVDVVVLRFSAVSARWRRTSLARPLYLATLEACRARGYRQATMGNEPNLMGHLTQPGLMRFKSGLGFRAVPSQEAADPQGGDEADLVLRLTTLNDPTLILGYAGPDARRPERPHTPQPGRAPGSALTAHLIAERPVDTVLFDAPYLHGVEVRPPALRTLAPPVGAPG